MKFEERLSEIVNEVEVPDELLPQNIAEMLRERSAVSVKETPKNVSRDSAQRRAIIIRTSAAIAACAVFAVCMLAYGGERESQKQLEAPIKYEATYPDSYDTLYDIYTGITLNGGDAPDSERTVG